MRYLILSDIHANIDALDAVLAAAPAGTLGPRRSCSATWSATAPSRTRVIDRDPRARSAGGDPRQSRQGGLRARGRQQLQPHRPARGAVDVRSAERRTTASTCARCPPGPMTIDDRVEICHGAPFDEDHYIFDADDARPRARRGDAARSACSGTRTCRWSSGATRRCSTASCPTARDDDGAARRGRPLPDQRGIGRTAARRRPAGGVRDLRFGGRRRWSCGA